MGGGVLNAYPIGSIYLTLNPDNPATYFGGVWEQIQGKFLLSADSSHGAGSTGGSFNKTLSTDNLPSHNHAIGSHTHSLNNHSHTWSGTTSENGEHSHSLHYNNEGSTGYGGGSPHVNGITYAGNGSKMIQDLWIDGI